MEQLNLTKAQVGGIIKILQHTDGRDQLKFLRLDHQDDEDTLVALATDGYVMALYATNLRVENHPEMAGQGVPLNWLRAWHANARNSDKLDQAAIQSAAEPINKPLSWQHIVPVEKKNIADICLDPDLMKRLNQAAGDTLLYEFYGEAKPAMAVTPAGRFLIMPIIHT